MIPLVALLFLAGCSPKAQIRSVCHVLKVDKIIERDRQAPDRSDALRYLAWCGEGRYVVFSSSVTPGDVVRFTEYQEYDQLQIHGYIEK